ncbi:MAG: hypothetical protein K5786_01415 [Treponema sp.]|nr:hypothetical protein [Treponema sp.]
MMNRLLTKHLFYLICAISLFTATLFFNGCRLYTEVNQEEVSALSAKTEIKAFSHLNNPLVFTIPVENELYLFGNKETNSCAIETKGFVYAVYDTSTNSLFDWAFCEGRCYNWGTAYCTPTNNSRYYNCFFDDGYMNENNKSQTRFHQLDSTTGKISIKKVSDLPYFEYSGKTEGDFYIHVDSNYHYASDGNTLLTCDYTLTLYNKATLETKEITFTSDLEEASFTYLDTFYVVYTEGNQRFLKTISDDASSLKTLLSFGQYEEYTYDLFNISENYAFFLYYKYWSDETNHWDYKKLLIYDLNQPEKEPLSVDIDNDSKLIYGYYFYHNEKFYNLANDSQDTDSKVVVYQSDKEAKNFEKKAELDGYFSPIKKIDSKIYLENNGNVVYFDLDTLEFNNAFTVSTENLLKETK